MAAGPYDPALAYRTITSPRFAVHYPPGARNLGLRVSRMAEEVLLRDAALFGFLPEGPIDIIMVDNTDEANGFAQVLPKNTIHVYLSAPTELAGLSSYEDWLRILLTHEIAHICDLDQTWGFTRALRKVFGKYVQWNAYTPQFLSEGVAVYTETRLTETGRGRSSYVEMMLRMAALEDRFLHIDQANVFYPDWPGGNVAYFYGGRFHLWLADQLGREKVADLHHTLAAQWVPYVYYFGAHMALGDSLPSLWDKWRLDERTYALEVQAGVMQHGITPSQRLTFHGRDLTGARYSPAGDYIVYSRSSPVDGATVRRIGTDGSDDDYLVLQTYSSRFGFSGDGRALYYAQDAINDRYDTWSDIYRYSLADKSARRLQDRDHPEKRLRARDPAGHPREDKLVFVQNNLQQSWLTEGTFEGHDPSRMALRTLVGPHDEVQHASPMYSPDGKRIVESVWFTGGRRDIVIIDAQTGTLMRRITYDKAEDGNPAWSPDGRYVLYESDSDGISNVYAFDTQTEAYFRITHVVGGAFQPSVDPTGKQILFRNASGIGFDIHVMPYDPARWEPQLYDPNTGYRTVQSPVPCAAAGWTTEGFAPSVTRAEEPTLTLRAYEKDRPYNPWPSLLPFHDNWVLLPSVYYSNLTSLAQLGEAEVGFNLLTGGGDAMGRHAYAVSAGASRYGKRPNWSASYTNDMWLPTLGAAVADTSTSYLVGTRHPVQRSQAATAGASWQVLQRHGLGVSYTFDHRTADAKDRIYLTQGDFASVTLGYAYAYALNFPFSVGYEHGKAISTSLTWYGRSLGASFDEVLVNFDARGYTNNPLFDNHVLALRLSGSLALGPDYQELFYLGGTGGSSFLTASSARTLPLRGLDGFDPGTGVMALYIEYRAPIWHVSRGLWTLPVFLDTLHAAVFCDTGNTFGLNEKSSIKTFGHDLATGIRHVYSTVGAEARANFIFGWAFGLTLRLGIATPIVEAGVPTGLQEWVPYIDIGTFI